MEVEDIILSSEAVFLNGKKKFQTEKGKEKAKNQVLRTLYEIIREVEHGTDSI